MPRRLRAGLIVIALIASACSVEPIEVSGIEAGSLTTTVLAADGSVIVRWHDGEDRVPVPFSSLPGHLVDAVVAIEDQRFWIHNGVDPGAVARAARANLEAGQIVQGGSTITQQYLKMAVVGSDLTIERKVEEAGLAVRLEEALSKREILERYLNLVFLGEGSYGVEAAAQRYFGVHAAELTLSQSALLAGLIVSPTTLNPYDDPGGALDRRSAVLDSMVGAGWLDRAQADRAAVESLGLLPRGFVDRSLYPYFTEEVRRTLLAEPALGDTVEERWELIHHGGLIIHTTIDPSAQVAAETAIRSVMPDDGPSAALVAIDPSTGMVRALVGGRDYYDLSDPVAQFNLATQGRRQPGSAFKPFALAAALDAGMDLDTVFPGGRVVSVTTDAGTRWTVANHEDALFPPLTLREATVFSVNTVYARVTDQIGPEAIVAAARAAGISTPLEPISSVALGTQEVTVLEMAGAYSTLAAGGLRTEPTLVTRVTAPGGDVLFRTLPALTRAINEDTAEKVTETLVDVVRRGTGQQAKIGRPVAGKTGTTEGSYDAWFVGYTPDLVAAVWIGFPEGTKPLTAPWTPFTVTGGTWPGQIWSRFAVSALSGQSYDDIAAAGEIATGLVTVEIDLATGFLAGPLCPRSHVAEIRIQASSVPTVECPIHNHGEVDIHAGTMPDVGDLDLTAAVSVLEAAGYGVTLSWDSTSDSSAGEVMAQHPIAGATVITSATVALTIAGPEPGTVIPEVLGSTAAEAEHALFSLGIPVRVILDSETPNAVPPDRAGQVWAQMPSGGMPLSGAVTIWVNPEPIGP